MLLNWPISLASALGPYCLSLLLVPLCTSQSLAHAQQGTG